MISVEIFAPVWHSSRRWEAAGKRPALLAAKQRVDEALRGAEGDAAGALERLPLTWSDYQPGYRTPAGTGTGLGFALWS